MRPDQLATVRLDGKVLDGELAPENAEIVAMHSVRYSARRDAGGIIHTHSPAATAFALAHRPLAWFDSRDDAAAVPEKVGKHHEFDSGQVDFHTPPA